MTHHCWSLVAGAGSSGGSHNGTFVNGKRISQATLTDQDIVSIGDSTLRLAEGELWQSADDDRQTQAM
jgi:pSer/pThr/pTyr-binding forkhead associated (FHA) protein